MIYLDNSATTMAKPPQVTKRMMEALSSLGNVGRGGHEGALRAGRVIYQTRAKLSELFGVGDPSQVVFTMNATESLNMVISGLFGSGDHVISTAMEHNSVLRPLYRKEKQGVELTLLPCDEKGTVRYDLLEQALRPNTKAVVCTHASNLTGNVVDIEKIGAWCAQKGIYFVVDASQTAGILPIHMENQHISALCFTGHKGLCGPQGTGGLCLAPGVELPHWKVGGSGILSYQKEQPSQMPTRLEAGTLNGHGIAGLYGALEWLEEQGIEKVYQKEHQLMERFYEGVKDLPGVTVYGDFTASKRAPIVALNIGTLDSQEVSDLLMQEYDIAVRGGAHCAPLMHEALGTKEQGAVRFSFGWANTENELDEAIRAVKEIQEETA